MSFQILGTGSALPACRKTNDDLSQLVDTSDEWITTRTGIKERRILTTETVTEIAVAAAKNALDNSGIAASELDYIICPTLAGDYMTPSLACVVQMELGASCPAVDINGACSGFLYGLDVAEGIFARKKARYVLVLAAERLSRILDWTDRSTCVLFGDAAAAVVLGEGDALRFLEVTAHGNLCLAAPLSSGSCPYTEPDTRKPGLLMKSREVYTFAVGAISSGIEKAAQETGISTEETDYYFLHQANMRIIETARKKLGLPREKFPVNIQKYGNTSAVSIPLLLDEWNRAGKLKKGQHLVMCAFGAGLTTGTAAIDWTI